MKILNKIAGGIAALCIGLAAAIAPLPAQADPTTGCTTLIVVAAENMTIGACIDNGDTSTLETMLTAANDDCEGCLNDIDAIAWCVVDADTRTTTCDSATESSAHPWCAYDPEDPGYCDFLCCFLTILNGMCDGCLNPPTDDGGGDE